MPSETLEGFTLRFGLRPRLQHEISVNRIQELGVDQEAAPSMPGDTAELGAPIKDNIEQKRAVALDAPHEHHDRVGSHPLALGRVARSGEIGQPLARKFILHSLDTEYTPVLNGSTKVLRGNP